MNIEKVICEARACSAVYGAKHALLSIYGENTDESYWNMLRINMYINVLERNKPQCRITKKKVSIEGTKVSLHSLIKNKNYLSLSTDTKVVCTKQEISPCLPDKDLCAIIENVRLMCSDLTCNCNN